MKQLNDWPSDRIALWSFRFIHADHSSSNETGTIYYCGRHKRFYVMGEGGPESRFGVQTSVRGWDKGYGVYSVSENEVKQLLIQQFTERDRHKEYIIPKPINNLTHDVLKRLDLIPAEPDGYVFAV